jgi:hypothetical protein
MKKAEFFADFRTAKKLQKNAHRKSYKESNVMNMSKSGKSTIFHHIFVNNFLCVNFISTFSTVLKSAWNCAFFISFLIFKNTFLGHLKPLFANFEAKSAQNGSKKQKNAFSKLVFNLHVTYLHCSSPFSQKNSKSL